MEKQDLDHALRWLLFSQSQLEARLARLEYSRVFRFLRYSGDVLTRLSMALHRGLAPLTGKGEAQPVEDAEYATWTEFEKKQIPPGERLRSESEAWHHRPSISLLLPLHNPRRDWLEAAVSSVLSQTYTHWELRLCDDGNRQDWLDEYLSGLAANDRRVRWTRLDRPQGMAASLNEAGRLASGDFVAWFDPGGLLAPHALHYVAEALREGSPDVLYSDEDEFDSDGKRRRPVFKPAWSPALLDACMYLGRLLVVSRRRIEEAGWFRSECEAACDHDLLLRLAQRPLQVRHIPRVLYHGRSGQCVAVSEKKAPHQAANGRISVIVCSRNARLLGHCLRNLRRVTEFPDWEIVLALHTFGSDTRLRQVAADHGCRFVTYTGPFNYSQMNNMAAAIATGEFLLFLNDDVTPLQPGWMRSLSSQLNRPNSGIAGAKLLYSNGTIQHAGIVVGPPMAAWHVGRHSLGSGYWKWLDFPRNVSAVTGACLGIRRTLFEQLGGFDIGLPVNYNDVDLCLRCLQAGHDVICDPGATLCHRECSSRTPLVTYDEMLSLFSRWPHRLGQPDPFYSPCLQPDSEEPRLSFDWDVMQAGLDAR